ncbi:methyltransferase 2-A [Brachionus plicatilis]|uniref:tRNA N(3)-methylcytidine methyltransferase n=1 Tax=Brachionus plicatilis TaxID=10195 RepID=A0A3M7T0T5_BRAPC|nr:methyltransferase 2-A [Brachionus plicatilis]
MSDYTKTEENDIDKEKRGQFGNRFLTDEKNVFQFNAWDNVEWDQELLNQAEEKIKINSSVLMSTDKAKQFEDNADDYWDKFYSIHENKFFKDRNWLFTEFPELLGNSGGESKNCEKFTILEVGCGVGNTIFPIIRSNSNSNLFVYGCDFSSSAIEILKNTAEYDETKCKAFVCDITDLKKNEFPIQQRTLDIIVMIFVLSAIKPELQLETVKNLVKLLKPGGKILFRDYGLYDLAQLRFKSGQCLEKNFYVRGDGTFVKFFTQDDVDRLFTESGLVKEQNIADKRLQINRGKQLKMYRVWIQAKYYKPKD